MTKKDKALIESIPVTISSQLSELAKVEQISETVSDKMGFNQDEKDNLAIAITEVVGNAIVHGNKQDPDKKVFVQFHIYTDRLHVEIQDEGDGFDPEQVDDPLDPANLMKESGRGIFILQNLIDAVEFEFSKSGTKVHLTMIKKSGD